MRPPEFTGGNDPKRLRMQRVRTICSGFNEAAGIHRRKPYGAVSGISIL